MNKDIVMFCGVPLVRVIKLGHHWWQVQMRSSENLEDWYNVGRKFDTKEKAVEQAPYICEF